MNRALQLYLIEGLSASEVAEALGGGLSRSAVVAKIRRLGFLKREVRQTAATRPASSRVAPKNSRIERRLPPRWPPIPLPPLREVGPTGATTLLACLRDGACRWPIDDPGANRMHLALFCAGPAPDGLYCNAHQAIASATRAGG